MSNSGTWIAAAGNGCVLTVKATPRASRTQIAGVEGAWLRVRVQAPPVDGRANAALTEFLAEALDLPRRSVTVLRGETGRLKQVHVAGMDAAAVRARLGL
jgi:uncharacterized protein (TIGR00251 family)